MPDNLPLYLFFAAVVVAILVMVIRSGAGEWIAVVCVLVAVVMLIAICFPGAGTGPFATPGPKSEGQSVTRNGRMIDMMEGEAPSIKVLDDGKVAGSSATLQISQARVIFTNAITVNRKGNLLTFVGRSLRVTRQDGGGATVTASADGLSTVILRVPRGITLEMH